MQTYPFYMNFITNKITDKTIFMQNEFRRIMKISSYFVLISSLLSIALNVAHSSPLVAIGDYGNVFFDGSSSLVWQSNIFYDEDNEKDEFMWVMYPGFEANTGNKVSVFDAMIRTGYEIQRFPDRSGLNGEYLHLIAVGSYDGARLDLDALYSFDEERTTAGQQGTLGSGFIEMDITRAHLLGVYILSPKFSLESGSCYYDRDFEEENIRLADVESFSIPIDVFYELTPKVDISFGYEHTFEEVSRSTEDFDRDSYFVNAGARGELLPKLNGQFKIGFRHLNPEGAGRESNSNLGLSANFTHLTTPKLTSKLNLNRGFQVGSEGQSVENTSAKLNLEYAISGNYLASAYTNLIYQDFKDGNDGRDFIKSLGLRFSYLANQYWRFGAGYAYIQNDSNRTEQGYTNNILDISASLRY